MLDLTVPNTVSHRKLDAKTLAALSTTCGKDSTATLGCHAGTEAMSLCALASVRLIGALHY